MTINNLDTTIRRATSADVDVLAGLSAATFTESFGHLYSPADLRSYLDAACSACVWNERLADMNRATWLAAFPGGMPIGFITVGRCKLPIETLEAQAGEVHQLYLLAKYHNLRLGSRLMDTGLEWLESRGHDPLYVGVWSENLGALRFYDRYGFTRVGEYGFPVGATVDREFILKR